MTRVALLITGLDRGGAELQTVLLAEKLRDRGYDVELFSLRPGTLASSEPVWKLIQFRPHILHTHLFHANIVGRLVRLFLPIPVVISTVHSLAETSRSGGTMRWRDLAYRLTDRLTDTTVFVSRAAERRHPTHRSLVIPNGIDIGRFHPAPTSVERPFTWLAAGRLMWKKNYPVLLEAMKSQPDARLQIAGDGPDHEALRALAPSNVEFLGSRDDMPSLMNAADAFVLSSSVEGLPMVLLEAAASGLPCVATAVGGVPEAVLDCQTGFLVPPDDSAALAAAMTKLAALPIAQRSAMGRAAREHAQRRFDIKQVADQWEDLYRRLLAEEA